VMGMMEEYSYLIVLTLVKYKNKVWIKKI